MNNQRHSKFHAILIASVILSSMLGTSAMTPLVPSQGPARVAASAQLALLQFSAGGHVLGFTAQGMYAATGSHALHVDFSGANPVRPQSDTPVGSGGKVAALSKVTYPDLWPGISLTYAATPGSLYTTTYTLAPGADAKNIRLHYNAPLSLNKDGSLSIAFQTGTMTESTPIAWQEVHGLRVSVNASFRVSGQDVSFNLGAYNPRYALTIDPSLTWNTFLGAAGNDYSDGIVMDGSGNIYVTGTSDDTWGYPVRAYTGGIDAFVAKLNSSGHLLWNTFLGGSADDYGNGITLDGSGNVYVTGNSWGAWDCSPVGCTVQNYVSDGDAFATKLDSSGSVLWNTFVGYGTIGYGIVVDGGGNVFVTGFSYNPMGAWGCSPVSCTVHSYSGRQDFFVAKLNSSGLLTWNTFQGTGGINYAKGIALDGSGNIYVTGYSN